MRKTIITDTCEHQLPIQYSNRVSLKLLKDFHVAFSSHPHIYRSHFLHMYRFSSVWKNFLRPLILFLPHTPTPHTILQRSPPEHILIAPCFIFDPFCCHVKLCFCFVDVMTIASAILMMCWDWPSAKQRSGTDEKTWLTDFLFSRSGVSVCIRATACVRLPVGCCIITDSPEIHSSGFSSQALSSDVCLYPLQCFYWKT